MSATSPTDIWASGGNTGPQGNGGELLHWDGATWGGSILPASMTGGVPTSLSGVSSVPGVRGTVWAVGQRPDFRYPAYAARWDGATWLVDNLPFIGYTVLVNGIVAMAANDVWAVGGTAPESPGVRGPGPAATIYHFDGTAWSIPTSPNSVSELFGVGGSSASDVWAVGANGLIEHWDGTAWSIVPAPLATLSSVVALSPSSAWAVGEGNDSSGRTQGVIEHWDGTQWSIVDRALVGYPDDSRLISVAAVSDTNVWASGSITSPFAASPTVSKSLVMHWDGASWKVVASPGGSGLSAAIVAPSATEAWIGGDVEFGSSVSGPYATFAKLCMVAPAVDGVNPVSGNTDGGTTVTITGSSFTFATGVSFGAAPATAFKILSDQWISATAPTKANGTVDVTVTNYAGTSTVSQGDLYIYVPPAISWHQYGLIANDGVTWQPIDASALRLTLSPTADSNAILSGNADLWTALAGVNQDLGISVSGGAYGADTLVGWKEGGGNSGTFSPTAAFVQTIIPVKASTVYTVTLEWKANHPTGGTIYVGAGLGPAFSPTRLTAELVPATYGNLRTASSTSQYGLSGSDGSTWQDMDASALTIANFTPTVTGTALLSANADLWTKTPTLNQDLGILVSGGSFGGGQIVGWKEGGGGAGTFSPTAAYVQAAVSLVAGTQYTIKLQWKTNFPTSGTILAGAGPGGPFSPTRLTIRLFPLGTGLQDIASNQQNSKTGSNGNDWTPVDGQRLVLRVQPAANSLYILSANADLWTAKLGTNQDIAIFVSGGKYYAGTLVAWKESGGRGGTFSPHAAYLQAVVPLEAGTLYTITLEWKANHDNSGTIYSGAGPVGPPPDFSPTRLTAQSIS